MAEYLRLVDGRLQTAVHRYVNRDTGRRVVVVGTRHFGDPTYWDDLRALIKEWTAAGAVVQSEGSRLLTGDDADGTDEERQLIADLRRSDQLAIDRLADLGWVHQEHGLVNVPQLQVVDLSYLQVLRRLGPGPVRKILRSRQRLYGLPDEQLRLVVVARMRLRENDRSVTRTDPRVDGVLIRDRDEVALDGVSGVAVDTVMVRGIAHLPGIGAGLKELGFVRSGETQWFTAASQVSIRSAWAALRSSRKG